MSRPSSFIICALVMTTLCAIAQGGSPNPQRAKLLTGLASNSRVSIGVRIDVSIALTNYQSLKNLELNVVSKSSKNAYPSNVIQFVCSANEDNSPETCPAPKASSVNSKDGVLKIKFFLRPSVFRFSGPVSLQLRASVQGTGRSLGSSLVEILTDFTIVEAAAPKISLQKPFPANTVLKPGDDVSAAIVFANTDSITYSKVEVIVLDESSKDSYPLNVLEFVCSFNDNNAPDECPAIVSSKDGKGVLSLKFLFKPNKLTFSNKARFVVKTTWAPTGSSESTKFEQVLASFSVASSSAGDVELGENSGLKKSYKKGDTATTLLAFQSADQIEYSDVEIGLISKAKGASYPRSVVLFVCSPEASGTADSECPALPPASGPDFVSTVPLSFSVRPNVFGFKGAAALYVKATWRVAGGAKQQLYKELATLSIS